MMEEKDRLVERLRLMAGFMDNINMECPYCNAPLNLTTIIDYIRGFEITQLRNMLKAEQKLGVLCCGCIRKAALSSLDHLPKSFGEAQDVIEKLRDDQGRLLRDDSDISQFFKPELRNRFVTDLLNEYSPRPRPRIHWRVRRVVHGKLR